MVFTAIASITGNYVRVSKFDIVTSIFPVFLSQKKINLIFRKCITTKDEIKKIVRLLIEVDPISITYNNGFLFLKGKIIYYLIYVGDGQIIKAKKGFFIFDHLSDIRSIRPEKLSKKNLEYDYKYSLKCIPCLINNKKVVVLIILTIEIDIYLLKDLLIRVIN